MVRIAVTGGTGFLGAHLIKKLFDDGAEITALARRPENITAPIRIIKGDLNDQDAIDAIAAGTDIFFHLAGVTHARHAEDYHLANVCGAENAAVSAAKAQSKFIHISSMSAREPTVSPYAASKHESESVVSTASGDNPWLALRLPAIYGPGDTATLPYFKMVKSGFALEPKTDPPARASILFAEDAVEAMAAAAHTAPTGHIYEVGDDRADGHAWSEIGETLATIYGKRARRIRAPRPLVAAYQGLSRAADLALKRTPSFREGQINEFFEPDWTARNHLLNKETDWRPQNSLKEGFAKTVHWYQNHGLL